ncbi:MAG: aminopeptidase [Spirochaetia bacterium]|nr:aminopeptidase [Spirochaetia bacterium]
MKIFINLKKNKILFYFFVFSLLISLFFFKWIHYLYHLAKHQISILGSTVEISNILNNSTLDEKTRKKLNLLIEVKDFALKEYQLNESKAYLTFVQLPRNELGWNITAAYSLEMKAKEFYFPFIGSFSYLGFFDNQLKDKWKQSLLKENFDVYETTIAAYSTLGILNDPVFSTYLEFSDFFLIRLIFHEIAHEKLYFTDDTNFSESLASFIEIVMLKMFLKEKYPGQIGSDFLLSRNKYSKYILTVHALIDEYKHKLENLYSEKISDENKLTLKKKYFTELRQKLTELNENKKYEPFTQPILDVPELNNAFLIQFKRYRPHLTGFKPLLLECNDDIICFFKKLEKLKDCDVEKRQIFLNQEISYSKMLNICRNN